MTTATAGTTARVCAPCGLPLSLVVLTRPYYRENRYLQVLRSTVALNSSLGFPALCKLFFALCIKFDTCQILYIKRKKILQSATHLTHFHSFTYSLPIQQECVLPVIKPFVWCRFRRRRSLLKLPDDTRERRK